MCTCVLLPLPLRLHSHFCPASLFARLRLSALISRSVRDLEDSIVALLSSPSKRARLSRDIAAAAAAARKLGAVGTGGRAHNLDGGASGETGAPLNAALRLGYEAVSLGYSRVIMAGGD